MSIETTDIHVHGQCHEQLIQSQIAYVPDSSTTERRTADLSSLINNREYSDITILCEGKKWHCHQAILYQRCPKMKQLHYILDGENKILFINEVSEQIEQLLRYIYTLDLPTFLPRIDHEDYEAERTRIWWTAVYAYHSGLNLQLEPLKKAGLETIMFHAPKLVKGWDAFNANMKQDRLSMVTAIYDVEGPENEIGEIRLAVMRGMVQQAHKMADSPYLRAALRRSQQFMIDYTWTLARKVRKVGKKRRARGRVRGGRDAPIVIS